MAKFNIALQLAFLILVGRRCNNDDDNFMYVSTSFSIVANLGHLKQLTIIMYFFMIIIIVNSN